MKRRTVQPGHAPGCVVKQPHFEDASCQIDSAQLPTPDSLVAAFHDGVQGKSDIDVSGVVHDILRDLIDSFRLAGATDAQVTEVQDYVVNHYGDL